MCVPSLWFARDEITLGRRWRRESNDSNFVDFVNRSWCPFTERLDRNSRDRNFTRWSPWTGSWTVYQISFGKTYTQTTHNWRTDQDWLDPRSSRSRRRFARAARDRGISLSLLPRDSLSARRSGSRPPIMRLPLRWRWETLLRAKFFLNRRLLLARCIPMFFNFDFRSSCTIRPIFVEPN